MNEANNNFIIYGGFYFDKNEVNSVSNEMDQFLICSKKEISKIEKSDLYNDEKFNLKKLDQFLQNYNQSKSFDDSNEPTQGYFCFNFLFIH